MRIILEGTKKEFESMFNEMNEYACPTINKWMNLWTQIEQQVSKLPDDKPGTPLDRFFETKANVTYPSLVPPSEETKHKVVIVPGTGGTQVVDSRSIQEIQSDHKKWLEENKIG